MLSGSSVKDGLSMEGECLKRPPIGYDAEHKFIEDIRRKTFFLMHVVEPSLATKAEFIEETEQAFKGAAPLMAFITGALGLSF